MKLTRIALVVVMSGLAGCATQGSVEMVNSDMDSVKTRLYSVEKDLGVFREESKAGISAVEKGYKSDIAEIRKLSADIQASVDSAKADIQALNGKVDDLTVGLKKPTEDLGRYREDADKRIISLDDRVVKLQAALDELGKKISETPVVKKEEVVTPESAYTKGLEAFKAGNMPAAREILTKFLEQNPKHELAANAQYWIAETFFAEASYEAAILAYQEVIKQYPDSKKVPAAMYKQAMSFKAIKDYKSAKYVLKKLVEEYPKHEVTKKGREMLKELK
jgi:tol-pal system protein YbgF